MFLIPLLLIAFVLQAETAPALPVADIRSITEQIERHQHSFEPEAGGHVARNAGSGWSARVDGRGFAITSRAWTWGLELRSYGLRGSETKAGPGAAKVDGPRLTLDRGGVEEWFVNRRDGLEHGFTVRRRPNGGAGPLTFRLGVRGGLRASGSGDELTFLRGSDTVLRYSGLKAWDATGKPLAARLEGRGGKWRSKWMCKERSIR